jgi:hypothetical protein
MAKAHHDAASGEAVRVPKKAYEADHAATLVD